MSDLMKRLWADPEGPFEAMSDHIKRLWADLGWADIKGPFKNMKTFMKSLWDNHWEERQQQLADFKEEFIHNECSTTICRKQATRILGQ